MAMVTTVVRKEVSLNYARLEKKKKDKTKDKMLDTIVGNMELVYLFTVSEAINIRS